MQVTSVHPADGCRRYRLFLLLRSFILVASSCLESSTLQTSCRCSRRPDQDVGRSTLMARARCCCQYPAPPRAPPSFDPKHLARSAPSTLMWYQRGVWQHEVLNAGPTSTARPSRRPPRKPRRLKPPFDVPLKPPFNDHEPKTALMQISLSKCASFAVTLQSRCPSSCPQDNSLYRLSLFPHHI